MRWIATMATMASTVMGAVLISGCANGPGDSAVDWVGGAKHGWVVSAYAPEVGAPGDSAAALPPCLAALPAEELASHHFVNVSYRHVRSMHHEIAELPPGLELKPGDRIELWPASCEAGKLSRITKVFPAAGQVGQGG